MVCPSFAVVGITEWMNVTLKVLDKYIPGILLKVKYIQLRSIINFLIVVQKRRNTGCPLNSVFLIF